MVKEGERTFLECLDQLEVARAKLEDVSLSLSLTLLTRLTRLTGYIYTCTGAED